MKYIIVELCTCWCCKVLLIIENARNEQYENTIGLWRAQFHKVSWLIAIIKQSPYGEGGTSGWLFIFNEDVAAHFRGMLVILLLPKRWQTKVYCEVPVRVITQHLCCRKCIVDNGGKIVHACFLLHIYARVTGLIFVTNFMPLSSWETNCSLAGQ